MALRSGASKLARLRDLMELVPTGGLQGRGIQALIVNSDDAHQSEYKLNRDERRAYISGFKGSLGTAVITTKEAAMFTDGRYFVQATQELDPPEAWTLIIEGGPQAQSNTDWLISVLPPNSTVGADPTLTSYTSWVCMHIALTAAGHRLIPLDENLIDKVWGDERPPLDLKPIVAHPLQYSGQKASEKIARCRQEMEKNKVNTLVIAALDEVAYLLNLRGSDIPYNPVFFGYVIVTLEEVHLFIDKSKLAADAEKQLKDEGVEVIYHPYNELRRFLQQIAQNSETIKIWISNYSSYALHVDCGPAPKHASITPVKLMKATKNSVEAEGMKAAHIRDAVALVQYFAWLEDMIKNKKQTVTEISGADKLENFRKLVRDYFLFFVFNVKSLMPFILTGYKTNTSVSVFRQFRPLVLTGQ